MEERNNLKGLILLFLLVFWAAVALLVGFYIKKNRQREVSWHDNNILVAHALGTSGAEPYNSLEGFKWSYSKGQRVFECDFAQTSDGELVLAHSFSETGQKGIDDSHVPTLEKFLNTPLEGEYTPLSLRDMLSLMKEYPDIYIVTDFKCDDSVNSMDQMKRMVRIIRKEHALSLLNRFVIQFYDEQELPQIRKMAKFGGYIYTLYKRGFDKSVEDFEKVAAFCRENDVDVVVMKKGKWNSYLAPVAAQYGIKVYPHTVYTTWQLEYLLRTGISGAYSDGVTPEDIERLRALPPHWFEVADYLTPIGGTGSAKEAESLYRVGIKAFCGADLTTSQQQSEWLDFLQSHEGVYLAMEYNSDTFESMTALAIESGRERLFERVIVFNSSLHVNKQIKPYIYWCDMVYKAEEAISEDNPEHDFENALDDAKEKGISVIEIRQEQWKEEYREILKQSDVKVLIEGGKLIK